LFIGGIVAGQTPIEEGKKFKVKKTEKLSPKLRDKISKSAPAEEVGVIVFYKRIDQTNAAKTKALSSVSSMVRAHGGRTKYNYNLVDALSAKLPAGEIEELSKSEDIENIYFDEILTIPPQPPGESGIKLDVSASAIGADYAWNTLGYTGSGIKVAVLDTGINYSHSDLGGGIGPSFKVLGGYDFYNGDSVPLDDHGHGTHVAGIVAANGSIKGVAPNASLLAVKVCSSGGSCPSSNIIAGIDWSVANGADVISMSIGGNAQPNDEFQGAHTIVADAAVDSGVIVVIAAGNEGPGTGTTGRPGIGKKVITVGASNDQGNIPITGDTIATFSNRGPSAFGRLDPEVVAPGVSINSTCITSDGTFCVNSGTSMATPHVSGAAALLLQKNSTLTPADVRRILMHTASNLTSSNIHVFEKGAGIINVSKALTYNISASINGDDRWEASILPGLNASTILELSNNNNFSVNFTFHVEVITDLEGDNSLPNSSIYIPKNVTVEANNVSNVKVEFRAPSNASPAIYGTTLVVSNDSAGTLRIPVVLTVPLVESGLIQGTVDDDRLFTTSLLDWGDWIYYKLKSHNATSLYASLNWTDSDDDLDLYLYAPNGETIDSSIAHFPPPSGTSEQVTLSNMVYDEYWLAIHAYILNDTGSYNLTVKYPAGAQGNLLVSPSKWQGVVGNNETKNITFTITNDANPKSNLNLTVNYLQDGDDDFSSGSASPGAFAVWSVSSSGINAANTRFINATLRWNNTSKDLQLHLAYKSGGSWFFTRFSSQHNNSQLGEALERIENADIKHYLKTYDDFGIGINNTASSAQAYNLTVNLTDISPWNPGSVNETSINLSAGQVKSVSVSINGSAISDGSHEAFFMITNSTEDFATVPISILAASLYDSRDTSPPSTGGTWSVNEDVNLTGSGWEALQIIQINITNGTYSQVHFGEHQANAGGDFIGEFAELGEDYPTGTYKLYVNLSTDDTTNWVQFDSFEVVAVPEFPLGSGLAFLTASAIYFWMRKRLEGERED
jgi:serine protease AprX